MRVGTTPPSPPTTVIGEHLASEAVDVAYGPKHLFPSPDLHCTRPLPSSASHQVDTQKVLNIDTHYASCRADGQSAILLGSLVQVRCRLIGFISWSVQTQDAAIIACHDGDMLKRVF